MKYRYWFAALTGVSSREKLELLKIYKSPEEIFWIPEYRLEKEHRIPEKTVRALQAAKRDPGWEASYLQMAEQGVELVCIDQPGYPSRLLHIYDPPYGLFVKGTLPAGEHAVAIVGARGCSVYGQAVAKRLGQLLGEHGVDVVSGLACGIDGAAHRGALEAGGGTWGVLGCGVDICRIVICTEPWSSGAASVPSLLRGRSRCPTCFPGATGSSAALRMQLWWWRPERRAAP